MIDYQARKNLIQQRQTQGMMDGVKRAIVDGFSARKADSPDDGKVYWETLAKQVNDLSKTVAELGTPQTTKLEIPQVIVQQDSKLTEVVAKIGNALPMIYKAINRPFTLPKLFKVEGEVEVTRQPAVEVKNLNELKKYFESLEKTFNNLLLAIHSMPQPHIKMPKIEIPAQVKNDNPELLKAIVDLNSKIEKIGEIKIPEVSMTSTNRLLADLVNKPTYTPTPVTNVGINGLEGFAKSTQVTVGTTLTTLPAYGQLFNRRSMIIFNNSAATTVYIGGSDVTTSNGLPVLGQSYSPALDAGYDLQIYGRTASSTADCRVFEVSKDQSANIQE